MPTIKSVEKNVRSSARKHDHNKSVRSMAKTNVSKAEKAIQAGVAGASAAVTLAISTLDKAAKSVIHPRNAARRKSRLMKKLNAIAATLPVATAEPKAAKKAPKAAAKKAAPKAKKAPKAEKKAS